MPRAFEGIMNLQAVDAAYHAKKLAATGGHQTWFLGRRCTIFGGAAGIKVFLDPENVERATDGSSFDQFADPDGPGSLLKLACSSDAAIPFFINAPVPRIFTVLDNASQPARKAGYMKAMTTECIETIYYPALVNACRKHLPGWEARAAASGGQLNLVDAIGELVWDAVATYIYGGELPPEAESHELKAHTDAFLESLGKAFVFSSGWVAARRATAAHLKQLRAALSALREEVEPRKPRSLLEALAFDSSPHRLDDDAVVYESFHSTFVSLGGFRCWAVNFLMELLQHPDEMALVAAEATAGNSRCSTDFAFLQDGCTRATMGVHETKRTHTCLTNVLFGRARRNFTALGCEVGQGERVLAAMQYTNHDPTVWGEDAAEWRPSRMEHNGGASTHENGELSGPWEGALKYAFCAHGAGDRLGPCTRRRCAGEELSTLAIKLIVLEIIGAYELELIEGQDLSPRAIALPVPTSGLLVRIAPRGGTGTEGPN